MFLCNPSLKGTMWRAAVAIVALRVNSSTGQTTDICADLTELRVALDANGEYHVPNFASMDPPVELGMVEPITTLQNPSKGTVVSGIDEVGVVYSYTDDVGKTLECTFLLKTADQTPPVVEITGVEPGSYFMITEQPEVYAQANDNLDGSIADVIIAVDGVLYKPGTALSLPVGLHSVNANATDSSGNVGSKSVMFEITAREKVDVTCELEALSCDLVGNESPSMQATILFPGDQPSQQNVEDILANQMNIWAMASDGSDLNTMTISTSSSVLDAAGLLVSFSVNANSGVLKGCPSKLDITGTLNDDGTLFDVSCMGIPAVPTTSTRRLESKGPSTTLSRKLWEGGSPIVQAPECRPLYGEGVVLGEVCATVVDGHLEIVQTLLPADCCILESHLCNVPTVFYQSDVCQTKYETTVPIEDVYNFVCLYEDDCFWVAGHATVQCGDQTIRAYFEIGLICEPPEPCDCVWKSLVAAPTKGVASSIDPPDCPTGDSLANSTVVADGPFIYGSGFAIDQCGFYDGYADASTTSRQRVKVWLEGPADKCKPEMHCDFAPSFVAYGFLDGPGSVVAEGKISVESDVCGSAVAEGGINENKKAGEPGEPEDYYEQYVDFHYQYANSPFLYLELTSSVHVEVTADAVWGDTYAASWGVVEAANPGILVNFYCTGQYCPAMYTLECT